VAYLGYTLRMRTLFHGWPIMVNDTHTRRRRSYYYYKCHGLECCRHLVAGALYKNLDLKLLHSSVQTSAYYRSRRRHGKALSPRVARRVDDTSSVTLSAEQRHRRAMISDVSCRLLDRYAGAVPCTHWYARTHNWNWIRSGTRNSEAPVAVGLCVLTSGTSRQAERRHSAWTAVGPAGIQMYQLWGTGTRAHGACTCTPIGNFCLHITTVGSVGKFLRTSV